LNTVTVPFRTDCCAKAAHWAKRNKPVAIIFFMMWYFYFLSFSVFVIQKESLLSGVVVTGFVIQKESLSSVFVLTHYRIEIPSE
jgi:hypothetical protein